MLDQNLPIVIVYILAIAAREQETTENFISAIQMQQKRQKTDKVTLIEARNAALEKQQALANSDEEASWKARAHIYRTGALRKEDGAWVAAGRSLYQ
jgi:exopolysaccharide biosynthesis predicted pyruvyltransferase EpsI